MRRIQLEVFRGPHTPTAALLPGFSAIRLIAQARLMDPGVSSGFHLCVVDTGAAISLFPARLWHGAAVAPLGRVRVGGPVARDECRIEVLFAEVQCVLSVGNNSIGPLSVLAYLSESNEVPTLLGISGLIEMCELHVSIRKNDVYVQQ